MSQPPKYMQVMSTIERRVRAGDYLLREIPGERRIAEETGVSYMTARRAVTELLQQEVLIRQPNGALAVHPRLQPVTERGQAALLVPDYPSPYLAELRGVVATALESGGVAVRTRHFVHWDDPVIAQTVGEAGGTIIIPPAEEVPTRVADRIRRSKTIIMGRDLSADGIPSIDPFPRAHLRHVLEVLHELGHRRIDCVNAQPLHAGIHKRIDTWRNFLEEYKCVGRFWDRPAESYTDPTRHAYAMIAEALDNRELQASAIVCTTFPSAQAVTRAMWERGLVVGRDMSVCAMNIESPAHYCCPSIAGLQLPDLSSALQSCVDWFKDDVAWHGALLREPAEPVFFAGESVAPPA